MASNKKIRSSNYSNREKNLLIDIIQKRKKSYLIGENIKENKNIKKQEWESIYQEFIYRFGGNTKRTLQQIKIFWKNYCSKLKREDKLKPPSFNNFERTKLCDSNFINRNSACFNAFSRTKLSCLDRWYGQNNNLYLSPVLPLNCNLNTPSYNCAAVYKPQNIFIPRYEAEKFITLIVDLYYLGNDHELNQFYYWNKTKEIYLDELYSIQKKL
ncbi:hypothetical protein HZS_1982 [Henneguya salminicola]|nr:hypothetical protein HZS_1982 [Henneguya salminicola]